MIHSFYRERLRIDGFLTNCHTADRIFICDNPGKSLPRSVRIGKYFATMIHKGQIDPRKQTLKCNKCLQQDHKQYECPNQWTCRQCNKPCHWENECEEDLNETSEEEKEKKERKYSHCWSKNSFDSVSMRKWGWQKYGRLVIAAAIPNLKFKMTNLFYDYDLV